MIDNCDAGDTGMDKCPGLIGGVNDPSTSCNIQSPVNEQIKGVLTALPGNNPVTGWGTHGSPPPPPASSGSSSSSVIASPSAAGPGNIESISTTDWPVSGYIAPGSSSGAGSSCDGVVTVTPTMTALYTPGAIASSSTTPSAAGPTNPTLPSWSYAGCYTEPEIAPWPLRHHVRESRQP